MNKETCQGCPIEECHVEVDGLCNRCDDVEDWLADHDKQIRDEVVSEIINKINHIGYVPVCVDCFTRHNLIEMLEQMKGGQDE